MLILKHHGLPLHDVAEGGWFELPDGAICSPAYAGWADENGHSLEEAPATVSKSTGLLQCSHCGSNHHECPKCSDGWLVERHGPYSDFFGCVRFPACSGKASKFEIRMRETRRGTSSHESDPTLKPKDSSGAAAAVSVPSQPPTDRFDELRAPAGLQTNVTTGNQASLPSPP